MTEHTQESTKFETIYNAGSKVSCKGSDESSNHPLIYLDLNKKGSAVCPYCSRNFVIKKPIKNK